MKILKAGVLYFALVFGAGFVLGIIRTLWVVPKFGARTAELIETPILFVIIVLAAKWVVRHFHLPLALATRLGAGSVALVFLLAVEFTVVLWLRGLTIGEYIQQRDPVAGTVYIAMLAVFAAMPTLVARK